MSFNYRSKDVEEPDIDVTSFMNLMIVLVPVLLLSMTFTQITVLDVKLPELTGGSLNSGSSQSQLDVVVTDQGFEVIFGNKSLEKIPVINEISDSGEKVEAYNFERLSLVMQEIKKQRPEKRDLTLLLAPDVSYQSMIQVMQNVKSYKTVVAASVVEIELFPDVSLGDVSKSE